jgi:ubiquinone/menaquinone biosynthesis C-methylase UbiE
MLKRNVLSAAKFWDSDRVVQLTDSFVQLHDQMKPGLHWYERYAYDRASTLLHEVGIGVSLAHVVGCGTGREIPSVCERFPSATVVASDFSEKMLARCKANVSRWKLGHSVRCIHSPAQSLDDTYGRATFVSMINNVMTYITPADARAATLRNISRMMEPGGILVGTVHSQSGRLTKKAFFSLRRLAFRLGIISEQEVGDRIGGFLGNRMAFHYATTKEVHSLLIDADFDPIEIKDLSQLLVEMDNAPKTPTSDNNIVFIARARL